MKHRLQRLEESKSKDKKIYFFGKGQAFALEATCATWKKFRRKARTKQKGEEDVAGGASEERFSQRGGI